MRSIRTKITILTVGAAALMAAIITLLSVVFIRNVGNSTSNQILYLLCEEGEKNLDDCFGNVERAVETVSSFAEADLKTTQLEDIGTHLDRVEAVFEKIANNTDYILTYYYRVNPVVSKTEKGFWYVDLDGKGFKRREPTDISQYDTHDRSQLVWFTVPKATGRAVWLPPYNTENLGVYVLSYNIPVYKNDTFIGVVGIEIDYDFLTGPVDNITLYENGYAFINDGEGNLVYHPRMNIKDATDSEKIKVPDGLVDEDSEYVHYTYEGVEKQAVRLQLENGMFLNVAVPINEINRDWQRLIGRIVGISLLVLLAVILLAAQLTRSITGPLQRLTDAAAQVDAGNYDVELSYNGKDEVGTLTRAFNRLTGHLKSYIRDLNDLAYADPLTSVRNKGAFDIYVRDMQARLGDPGGGKFAIGIFDCDGLKTVNDHYGHQKGDAYLKASAAIICKIFDHCPVFRIGGDEFAVVLQNESYAEREELARRFEESVETVSASDGDPWTRASLSMGLSTFDPKTDRCVNDVIRRADMLMYENKRVRKENKKKK